MARSSSDDRLWRSVKPVLSTQKDDKGRIKGLGTAFVCGKEGATHYLLTCWHVVEAIGRNHLSVMGREARVIALGDKALDLALLAVDDLPESEILKLSNIGHEEMPFRTIGHFWLDEKQDVTDSRPLEGRLGKDRSKSSERYPAVAGWEFKLFVEDEEFDRIRAGYSGAPAFDPVSGQVMAVISHQQGDERGQAIDVSNLEKIYANADAFFDHYKGGEGGGIPWIVKTLDHVKQARPMRDWLRNSSEPVVAIMEGFIEDCPKYLADDVFLDPWPTLDDIPQEAMTLDPHRFWGDESAFWKAIYRAIPLPQQATEQNQECETVRNWLRGRDRHLFYVSVDIKEQRRDLPGLINAAQSFLAELAREEPGMRLLVLFVCQPHEARISWWWPLWLWRRLLLKKRQAGVRWLVPLQPLTKNDLSSWYDGFSGDTCRQLNRDRLIEELLDLFEDGRPSIHYRPVSKRLVELIQPKQA